MEMALRNSEERYNLVTKLSGYVVYDYDIEKQRVIWAGAVKDVLGYTPDELNENNFEKLLELIHPDDINLVKRKLVTEPDSIHSSKTQYRYLTKNKGYIWVETQAFLFTDDQNKQCRWLGIMRDITGQLHIDSLIKASEEKLRTIFDTSKDGILLLDRNLCVIDINQSALIKIGYSKEDIIGGKAKKFLHSDTSLLAQKLITDWANASIDNFETEVLTKDQSSFPVEINAATMRFNNQDVLLLMIRDITERKKLEKELLHSVINTEEMERLRFSQELHDGLGPLLSAAKLYTEWLAEPDSNIDPKTIIADIQKLLEESNKTVREISFKLSPHILQNYGIAEAINAYAEKAEKSGKVHISIKTSNFKRFDETIEAIIYRVICECINNTIKHAKAQNIAITLQLAENNICIDYKDDGIGFDINTLKLKQKGIGLLNMQSRLKSINGQISIQSAINNGIKISIKIPLGII
jgi:PAS domain S-box-containing protein